MNIVKENLKDGIWYEDEEGNVYKQNDPNSIERPNDRCITYHTQWPLEIRETIYRYYDNKDTCKHRRKYRIRTWGWKKGIKGCKCNSCGKTKVGKSWIPFAFMKWDEGNRSTEMMTCNTHIGRGNEDVILAMANSGDYTLSEAIIVWSSACERFMNVLTYKYTNGKDGYEEFSDEWYKCRTVCDFCKEEW